MNMKSVIQMNTSSQEGVDFPDKLQEDGKIGKRSSNPSSSSSWLRLKNPRIVRVSRAFGGKDRHSKVCTVRGLRDRRVRLSVPTAIQLYDLQDRLGLNQPSKVVDWLLNVAKDDIDDLPPLQMPPLSFLAPNQGFKIGQDVDDWEARASFWSAHEDHKSKQVVTAESDKESFNTSLPHHHMPYSSFCQWEPNNNFPLLNMGMSHGSVTNRLEDVHHHNVPLPGQMFVQPYFPAAAHEVDPRSQFSQFQMLMMSSSGASSHNLLPMGQSVRPFQFEFGVSGPQHSPNNGESDRDNKNQQEQFQER